jgi:hypothetical protein
MRKFSHLDVLDRPKRRRSKAPLVVLVLLLLVASPPLYELARLNLAKYGLFGLTGYVDTPLLDTLSKYWETSHGEIRDWIAPLMVNRKWNPRLVLPIAFLWTAWGAFMLRRGI